MYLLLRAYVWLSRFSRLGGNGVQSPFVYNFVCEVIYNTSAYYAYGDMAPELKSLTAKQRKLAKLLFRLVNRVQPAMVWLGEGAECFAPFVRRGCRRAKIAMADTPLPGAEQGCPVLLVANDLREVPLDTLPEGSAVMLLGIRSSQAARQDCRTLMAHPRATLTFDLYHTLLTLVCPDRYKQHFKINF